MILRISQGLIHLGKGTMTLNPFHTDRQLICPTAVAALISCCMAFIDAEQGYSFNFFFQFKVSFSR